MDTKLPVRQSLQHLLYPPNSGCSAIQMAWTRGQTIGRGSFATVSVATVHGSDQVLAVKSTELAQSEFLQREQKTLSTLNCPQIVEYKGCDITLENGRLLYNVLMEYAPQGTLADSIRNQGGRLDEASIKACTRSIVLGLQCLHSNGIVHCDIKCHNILVTHEGVKIADLGCARRLDDVSENDLAIAGTPVFMAPEVARGEKQGFPADVWALGCTMIEMATGRSPWPEISDPVSALYRIGYSGDVPEVPSLMSKQAKDFLDKCLKRDPVERWSASELLSHAFLEETISLSKEVSVFNSDTPNSVLDQGFWDSIGELDATNPTHKSPLSSPRERIRQLSEISTASSQRMPDWVWDEHWITVRSNSSKHPEMFYSSQEYELFYANEDSTTASGICLFWVSQDKELVHFNEPTRTGGKESCNISNTNSNYSTNSSNVIGMWRGVRRRRSLIWPMNVRRMPLNVKRILLWGKNNMDIFSARMLGSFFLNFTTILSELATDSKAPQQVFHMLPWTAFLLLWCLSLLALLTLAPLYILRCFFHFPMVKAEILHHIGVNFLYAPSISWLPMLQSTPLTSPKDAAYQVVWFVFTVPVMVLDVKIYEQWFTKRFLSMVANPTSQISVLGNLVGARAAAQMGWKQSAVFMFSLGIVHYLVLFITLYHRLSGGNYFPVLGFFLFFAAPSMASLAWSSISGAFDTLSKPALFKKATRRFNIAWWAYSFPLTFLALASTEYAQEVKGHIALGLMLVLLILSVLVFLSLMLLTALKSHMLFSKNDPIMSFANELRTAARPHVAGGNTKTSNK